MTNYFNTPEEAIQAAQKAADESNYYIEFDGHNCEDLDNDCPGWDGVDRRCSCGNRRVGWETSELNGKYYAYAAAY